MNAWTDFFPLVMTSDKFKYKIRLYQHYLIVVGLPILGCRVPYLRRGIAQERDFARATNSTAEIIMTSWTGTSWLLFNIHYRFIYVANFLKLYWCTPGSWSTREGGEIRSSLSSSYLTNKISGIFFWGHAKKSNSYVFIIWQTCEAHQKY